MTVSGDDYTFVANHTIPADVEIIFGANDTLIINAGVDVILEGKLYVIDETVGIIRITVNGTFTMQEGSEIEICGITNGGIGILVSRGTFTQNGGDIIITNVTSPGLGISVNPLHGVGAVFNATAGAINIGSVLNGGLGIYVIGAGQFNQSATNITITNVTSSGVGILLADTATYTQNGGGINITNVDGAGSNGIQVNSQFNATAGAINVGSVLNGAQGINVINAGQFNQSATNINITNVDGGGSDGIRVNNAGSNFTLSGGSIQISSVTNEGQGIDIINEGTFNQNGLTSSITITNVNSAFGIEVTGVNSQFTTSAGTINVGSVLNGAQGINVINAGQFNQSATNINITNVDGAASDGIRVNGNSSVFNASGGTIQIVTVTNNALGINVRDDGVFTQAGTNITITNVTNLGIGIAVFTLGPGLTATYTQITGDINITNVTNLGIGIAVFTLGPGLTATYNQNAGNINITNVDGTDSEGIGVGGNSSVFNASGGTIQIDTVTSALGIDVRDEGAFNQNGLATSITFGQLTTNATAIEITSDSTFTKANGPTISITNAAAGGGTSGMVVTGTITGPVVTNSGGNNSIDMTNSDTPYSPLIDPFDNPWDGAGSSRAFYAP
jgi:hypothetical protein